ncbi:hypothetical protein VRY85_09335 [Achromobacter sp. F4_2707]|uniref:hypothetical protein n=1 Tax=Achromobacter sp. F4_2707 TaxID=3114286 RepID=UPI0039C6B7B3
MNNHCKTGLSRVVVLAALAGSSSGCALNERMIEIGQAIKAAGERIEAAHESFTAASEAQRHRAAQDVDQPWLAGKSQPLAREVTLPMALRANVDTTLLFVGGPAPLPVLAQRITRATGIPVHVRPESLLPLEAFVSRLGLGAGVQPAYLADSTVSLDGGPEPLAHTLDRIGARLGVRWRYQDERIEFYRTETRAFDVRLLTLQAAADASLGLQETSSREGFSSTSRTELTLLRHDPLASVKARVEPFLSRAGSVVAEPGASAMLVVTDTPEVLRDVAAFIERENRALTRRVRLLFEELTVLIEDGAEAGIDWNIVFTGARAAAATSMAGVSSPDAGALSVGVTDGRFLGSELLVKALGKVGHVVRRNSLPVLTLNRRPVTHAVRTTFSYIDKVETVTQHTNFDTALPSVSVSQREETVGSLITLMPDAQEDGQVLLSVAYDNTVAQPLKSVTFGDGDNPLQLQQITIDGNGTVQQVALMPGQPLVISGFDRSRQETEARRLNPGLPLALGGSDRAGSQRLTTIMVVTAHVEEGF